MKKTVFAAAALVSIIAFALLFQLFANYPALPPKDEGRMTVVATFYPLYDFAKNVGGERVSVTSLIPPGVEPHEYELTPSAAREVAEADVFLYNGAGMEPWVPALLAGIGNAGLDAVDTSANIPLISSQDPDETGSDPHVWLDPVLAKEQVAAIRDAFIEADPAGRSEYEENAAAYLAKLDALDGEFRSAMADCGKREVLITHATLAYFCREYNCTQIPIAGVNPEAEPLPSELAAMISQARERNVTTIFVERLLNPAAAETIARELGGGVAVFNSVHGVTPEEQAAGSDYLSLMRGNVQTIKGALACS